MRISIADDKEPPRNPRPYFQGFLFFAAMLPFFFYSFWKRMDHYLNLDVSWQVYAAELMMEGQKLYRDILEFNLPFSYYIYYPPVILSENFGLDIITVTHLYLHAIPLTVIAFCLYLYGRSPSQAVIPEVPWILLICAVVLFLFTRNEVGQRDHIVLTLLLPYIVASQIYLSNAVRGVHNKARLSRVISGILLGIAIAIKPHYIILVVATELFILLKTRRFGPMFRAENLIGGAVCVGAFLDIVFRYPEFLGGMLGMASATVTANRGKDSILNPKLNVAVFDIYFCVILIFLLSLGLLNSSFRKAVFERSPLLSFLYVATIASGLIVVAQGKGFSYHFIPVILFSYSLLYCCFRQLVVQSSEYSRYARLHLVFCLIFGVLMFAFSSYKTSFYIRYGEDVRREVRGLYIDGPLHALMDERQLRTVFALSTSVDPMFPLIQRFDLTWAGRFHYLWPLPYVLAETASTDRKAEIESFMRRVINQDMRERAPDIVIVATGINKRAIFDDSFEYLRFFRADACFDAIWKRYDKWRELRSETKISTWGQRRYDVYVKQARRKSVERRVDDACAHVPRIGTAARDGVSTRE